jgi:alanine racemase
VHTWLEISKTSLLNNVEVFKKISAGSDFMPVIKSNAYGHGMREVAEILVSQDDIKRA